MKKIVFLFSLIVALCLNSVQAMASVDEYDTKIVIFEDGSYLVTTICDVDDNLAGAKSSSTVTKSKILKYYSASNVAQWYVQVTGTFSYGDGMSRCLRSEVSAATYLSKWRITEQSASKSHHTAIATATAEYYEGNTLEETVTREVRLSCSPTGEFS